MKTVKLENLKAIQTLDSRGNPTLYVEAISGDCVGSASVPSGASTGQFEAYELRDNDKTKYNGKGVEKAVKYVNEKIATRLISMNIYNQIQIDKTLIELDGSKNKEKLGANAILGVSLAIADLAAKTLKMPLYKYIGGVMGRELPTPMMNILNGGKHANNNLSIQEFMIIPKVSIEFKENLRVGTEIYHALKEILKKDGYSVGIGDEGGFAPDLENEEQAIGKIIEAIKKAGYKAGKDVFIGLDIAATEMYEEAKKIGEEGKYYFWKTKELKAKEEMINYILDLTKKYPIISIEDGLAEEDWEGWKILSSQVDEKVQIVGDDLFVTNKERLEKGIKEKSANAILIKPNQIGTLTETLETIEAAKKVGFKTIISHRSGETEDTKIADLAVALNLGQIKTGAPCRMDRVSKYNRLLYIENELFEEEI